MSKPAEVRIIPCGACGGDGGHNGFDDVWERCNLCSGEGELEYDVEPVGLEDFQKANEEAAVSKVEFLIENLVQAAAEYENNCDRLVAKAIRIQLENAKQAIRDAIIPAPAQSSQVPFDGEEAIKQAAQESALTNRVYRSEGDLWTDAPINLSKFVRLLALAAQPPAAPVETRPSPLADLPEYLDYLEQSLVDLDIDLKLPANMQSPSVWADRVRGALSRSSAETAQVRFGFASFKGGKFELIVINIKTGEEVLLEGQLRPDQTIEQIDKVLPTCVYVTGEPQRSARSEEPVAYLIDHYQPDFSVNTEIAAESDEGAYPVYRRCAPLDAQQSSETSGQEG